LIECIVERELSAYFDRVWALVSNFGDLGWYETAERVEVIGEGTGQTRRIHIAGIEATVDEVLDSIDEEAHAIHYRVLKGDLVPFDDYTVTATITDVGNGKTHARWYATYGPGGLSEEDALGLMQGNYTAMLDMIERAATA
jgi:hypothetical protein